MTYYDQQGRRRSLFKAVKDFAQYHTRKEPEPPPSGPTKLKTNSSKVRLHFDRGKPVEIDVNDRGDATYILPIHKKPRTLISYQYGIVVNGRMCWTRHHDGKRNYLDHFCNTLTLVGCYCFVEGLNGD